MWQRDLVFLFLVILGLVLFLYGANYYSGTVGWTGIGLIAVGFFGYLILKLYEVSTKKKE
jgi:membrane-bound ClpP family serine protease